jgi:hypothetical protein
MPRITMSSFVRGRFAMLALGLVMAAACQSRTPAPVAGAPTPVYNPQTGRLEQLVSDRDGDGKVDTWAFMNGANVSRIEIDRNHDGLPDRWEYYGLPAAASAPPRIERAEEANGPDGKTVTRHEQYDAGILRAVDEDTDADGRADKWESYQDGRLARVDLDLSGDGVADQRLIYGANGDVVSVASDADGDGVFTTAPKTGTGHAPVRSGGHP